ncbi:MAG TPA: haloacid dehalogenase type II [Myxococcales bacterium]|nr:haloacid dehalogenase type II [Myxococcales bacterium]
MSDPTTRRQLIGRLAAIAGAALLRPALASAAPGSRYRAVAFDGFVLFDPRPIPALANELFGDKGPRLVEAWRTRQFDYQWLQALAGRYQDFWKSTESALLFAARSTGVDLKPEARDRLMQAWLRLEAWPDVAPSLLALRKANLRLAPLANLTPAILEAAIANSHLEGLLDEVISTDRAKTYKPDPRAYQLGLDVLRLRREEIVFAASAGWDAAGSRWFGYPTYWVNRSGAPAEELGVTADGSGPAMAGLVAFAGKS